MLNNEGITHSVRGEWHRVNAKLFSSARLAKLARANNDVATFAVLPFLVPPCCFRTRDVSMAIIGPAANDSLRFAQVRTIPLVLP